MSSDEPIQETNDSQHCVRELAIDLMRKSQKLRRESRKLRERNLDLLGKMARRWLPPVRQPQPLHGRKPAA